MKKQLVTGLLFLLFLPGMMLAQNFQTICGTVVDLNGNLVANHTVYIMGDSATNPTNTYYSTQTTNSNGMFCDTVPYNPNTAFSFTVSVMDCQNFYHSTTVNLNNSPSQVTFTICAPNVPNAFNSVICGTVTDLLGSPVASQTVYLIGDISQNPQNSHSSTVVTDAMGNFCDSVYFNNGTHDQFVVYTIDCNSLQVSQTINLNITTTANLQICPVVQSNCQICGILSTPNNVASTDSSIVYLIQYNPLTQTLTAVDSTWSFTSNPNSPTFCFYNVLQGSYLVKAAMSPWNSNYANYLPTYYGNSLQWSSGQMVTVCPSVNNANITFIAGSNPGGPGFIGGLVTQGANKTQNTALAGATVILKDSNGNNISWTSTDGNGAYSFSNLAYGTYHIWVDVLNLYGTVKVVTISAGTPSSTGNEIEVNLNPAAIESLDWSSASIQMYPNPAAAQVSLAFQSEKAGLLTVEVISLTGTVLKTTQPEILAGMNTVSLDLAGISGGSYWVKLADQSGSKTLPLVIVR